MKQRTYPVPSGARTGLLGAAATFDEIDLAATLGNQWAYGIRTKENARILASLLDGNPVLPFGVITEHDDDLVVYGLVRGSTLLASGGWCPDGAAEFLPLDADEVAFCARAFRDGHTAVVLRGYVPLAMLTASGTPALPHRAVASPALPDHATPRLAAAQATGDGLPAGARILAVVDDLDRNAVLDVVAVAPGPVVYRRHDGTWQKDDDFVRVLRSVKPPPVVELDETQLGSVLPQVDEQTAGQPFTKEDAKKAAEARKKKMTAAAGFSARADEMAIEFCLLTAIVAGKAASQATPGGRMPHELMTYWSVGPGAAKIRWGTPGAWRRCHRALTKYVGPHIAKGLCTNIGKRRGGHGVAHHVGG